MLSLALATAVRPNVSAPTMETEPLTYVGKSGPGVGKRIVFLAGDEEYRSEEGLPQLARILAFRHGFTCVVLFSLNPNGEIDPDEHKNQPGIEALDRADLCVMLLRFREWPDEQMKHFVDYYRAGKPFIALRTSTHPFDYAETSSSPYAKFDWQSSTWAGGFGRQVFGETWVSHWGNHGVQATRGVIEMSHPVLRGVSDVFGTTDVYEAAPTSDADVLMRGCVLAGLDPADPPAEGSKKTAKGFEQELNKPMMPIVWLPHPRSPSGKPMKVLTTTMGAATDLLCEDLRRLLVNACYWATGMETKIPARSAVGFVGPYQPTKFGFGGFKKGVRPADLAWPR